MDEQMIHDLACSSEEYLAYETEKPITWCGGCGNYAIQNALKRALVLEKIDRKNLLLCFDVGCNGNGSDKIEGVITIHGLHGRVLPLAAGTTFANPNLKVIAAAGDGATLSEGINHFVHAVRCNYPIVFLLHDNQNYALTTGQASSTTPKGCKMNCTPAGVATDTINPVQLALSLEPSFVARTISADVDHMTETIRQALNHKGFAFVHVLQHCPTYSKTTTNEWLLENAKDVKTIPEYNTEDIVLARKYADKHDKIYTGILHKRTAKKPFPEIIAYRDEYKTVPVQEVKHYDIDAFLKGL